MSKEILQQKELTRFYFIYSTVHKLFNNNYSYMLRLKSETH